MGAGRTRPQPSGGRACLRGAKYRRATAKRETGPSLAVKRGLLEEVTFGRGPVNAEKGPSEEGASRAEVAFGKSWRMKKNVCIPGTERSRVSETQGEMIGGEVDRDQTRS